MQKATLLVISVIILANTIAARTVEAQRTQRVPPTAEELKRTGDALLESFHRAVDPDLLQRAAEKGIYRYEEYPVLREMNPFFIRGDFNGDGAMDVAVWVTQKSSGLKGVAVIHSTLDSVRYLGAGNEKAGRNLSKDISTEAWHVLPRGHVQTAVRDNVPELGIVDGRPFTFERETLSFLNWGRFSFVAYWANGRYWYIGTGD